MCLVALEDPGLTVFPTHRLLDNLKESATQEALAAALRESFDIEEIERDELVPEGDGPVRFGYIDAHFKRPFRLTLKDQAIADRALPDKPEPYRRLDTAVLEALILRGALGMTEDDISHFNGLNYSKDAAEALRLIDAGTYDAAFFMRADAGRAGARGRGGRREHAAEVDLLLPEGAHGPALQPVGLRPGTELAWDP